MTATYHDIMYRKGVARNVSVLTADDLSIGTSLYFQFAESAAACFFVMTVFAMPAIIMCYTGSRIPAEQRVRYQGL
jgi:hypothetical protein